MLNICFIEMGQGMDIYNIFFTKDSIQREKNIKEENLLLLGGQSSAGSWVLCWVGFLPGLPGQMT